ncbi:uncharacterized protein LOC134209203 [Armigeres subalbatus]|uniref:uncharacterized protein LOC134209203 n=1 Tax=Armigeres subalbatus TaxID=124917 RepID=UPI002ED5CFEA
MTKWQRIRDLFHAQMSQKDISIAVGVSRWTVKRVLDREKKGQLSAKVSKGRPRSARVPRVIAAIKRKIRTNPVRSMRKMAKEHGISDFTVRKIVKEDCGAKSRARKKTHMITNRIRELRVERCQKILNFLKRKNPVILFTDESMFTVDPVSNSRTDRYISSLPVKDVADEYKNVYLTKHPASVIVFGLVASDGKKMDPVFIPEGDKVNTEVYIGILSKYVLPWIKKQYGSKPNVVFQQDGAPCHTSNRVVVVAGTSAVLGEGNMATIQSRS